MNKFIILTALLLTAGCSSPSPIERIVTVKEVVVPQMPEELSSCEGKPDPIGPDLKDQEVAELIIRLDHAHSDCNKTLEEVKKWLNSLED